SIVPLFIILCVICVVVPSECARILALFPIPFYSHQTNHPLLWLELAKRGHEVVVVTPNPASHLNVPNITQIDVSRSYVFVKPFDMTRIKFNGINWQTYLHEHIYHGSQFFVENLFHHPQMKELYEPNSNATFDVLVIEMVEMPSLFAFAHRFHAPVIGFSSLTLSTINEHILGGPVLTSHESVWEVGAHIGPNLSFWQRLKNFVIVWRSTYFLYRYLFPQHQRIAEKYLGPDLPPMLDIMKNISVIFVNQDDVLSPARSKVANQISFTSLHISDNLKPLPKELQRFVDEAENGFIYFSLGTNALTSCLPNETLQIFIDVFSKLPYRVVWKHEEELPRKPDNVFSMPWFPQQSLLAHPNIKMMIYQGGLQTSQEVVYFAVPVLGLPVLGDQDYQVRVMEQLGIGKFLDLPTLTRDQLERNILDIVTDKKYKERILEVRSIAKDKPYDLLEHLVWWTEFVIRRKGAPHLRTSLASLPWYQRYDTDIIVFLTIVVCIVIFISTNVFTKLLVYLYRQRQTTPANKKQK
ncbi:Ecdysteroid UDP-glucosyltransferase, partial [Dufourea novaeangliae]